jgi:hypothetical protein
MGIVAGFDGLVSKKTRVAKILEKKKMEKKGKMRPLRITARRLRKRGIFLS